MSVVAIRQEQPATQIEQAVEVLNFLNAKTGRKFPARNPKGAPTANSEVVMARFREGYTVEDCKAVIAAKYRQWNHDEKMAKYMTPETLFRRSNFERYLGELGE
jgi:uncharacterized phage protein (TIGR02220 family)